MQNFGMSMLWFWVSYIIVTLIGMLHTIFNIVALHMKSMKEGPGMGEGYEKQSLGTHYITLFYSLFLVGFI